MQGGGKDLERASKVHEVKLGMQGEENVNGLISHCRRFVCHLDDLVVVFESEVREKNGLQWSDDVAGRELPTKIEFEDRDMSWRMECSLEDRVLI